MLNDFYLHRLIIRKDYMNISLRVYKKESVTIQSQDLYSYWFHTL